jgi:hypothetical protein
MGKPNRPLWLLLLETRDSKKNVQLTCEECFTLLTYDAELLGKGAVLDDFRPAIRHHLSLCSGCQTKIEKWLGKMNGERCHPISR